ncbi:MAG: hypothetical protein BAJATHORv1_10163 [Candidatus Thorarchaeota archaeon]|nr:MAG: hypothetical protein BAJATHORv1_10163 [Candidatus Thorarchaeota archaeon]
MDKDSGKSISYHFKELENIPNNEIISGLMSVFVHQRRYSEDLSSRNTTNKMYSNTLEGSKWN